MNNKKFEVTQFHSLNIGESYFVKLHGARFTKPELSAIRKLRQSLNRKFPQTKQTANPASWRLIVETHSVAMIGRLLVLLPDSRFYEWAAFGSVEVVCNLLWERLSEKI